MNKIFKVIWNQATQSWVAVSELTKANKKASANSVDERVNPNPSFIALGVLGTTILGGGLLVSDASAQVIQGVDPNLPTVDEETTRISRTSDMVMNRDYAAAFSDVLNAGWNLMLNGKDLTVIKTHSDVNFKNGNGTTTIINKDPFDNVTTIQIDVNSTTLTVNDGKPAHPTDKGTSFVNATTLISAINDSGWTVTAEAGKGSVEGGKNELINFGDKVKLIAGDNMKITQNGANFTFSASSASTSSTPAASYTNEEGKPVAQIGDKFYEVNPATGLADATKPVDATKVKASLVNPTASNAGKPIVLDNVANGDISPTSTQAVNGSQLYALTGGESVKIIDVTDPDDATKVYSNVATNDNGEPLLKTYNVRDQKETITNSVFTAIQKMNAEGIKFFHTNDGEVTSTPQTSNTVDASAAGRYSTAIGYQAKANGEASIAFGKGAVANGTQSISVGAGNTVKGDYSGAIGSNNTVETKDTFVLGNNVNKTAENSVFLGSNTGYVEAGSTTAGNGALERQTISNNQFSYAGGKATEVVGVVSVGNVKTDADGNVVSQETRRIQNVAPGLISENSTDAINGSQLYAMASKLNATLGGNLNSRLDDLNNRLNKSNRQARAGIAGVNAAVGLPQVYLPGKSMVSAAVGTFKGQNALAIGYSKASSNGKLILKLQGNANSQGDVGGAVGIGYQW